jgi:hypothetical protein
MALSISDFKANFKGGARPNLYKVVVTFPDNNRNTTELATFMIKAASLPGSTIAPIPVPYRGRQLQVAGDRTFEPWTITVVNDGDMIVRNAFESWMNLVNAHEDNTSAYSTIGDPLGYMSTMSVTQLDRDGDEAGTKTYEFIDAFPTDISAVELGYETNDAVEEFTVTMSYQYWTSNTTT